MRKAKDRVPKFEREKQRECVRKAKDRIPKLVRGEKERERFSLEVSFQAAAAVALQPTLSVLVEEERARGRVGGGAAAAAGLTRRTCVTTA